MIPNFGYGINKSERTDLDKNNLDYAKQVLAIEPTFSYCIGCGSCTGTCSAGNFTDLNLRKLQLMVKRGNISPVKRHLEKCMLCGKCMLVCPRGVNTRNVILSMIKVINDNNL